MCFCPHPTKPHGVLLSPRCVGKSHHALLYPQPYTLQPFEKGLGNTQVLSLTIYNPPAGRYLLPEALANFDL